jgi:Tfp pilus assembly protein PilO
MQIKNRQQLLTFGAILTVVILLGDRVIISPLTRAWKERTARVAKLTESIKQGAVLMERERIIHDRWHSMQTNALPNDTSKAENLVMNAIGRWELESGVRFNSLKPQPKRNADDYMTIECRIDATGTLESMTKFVYNLETDSLPIKVEELEVTSRDTAGQQISLIMRITGLLISPQDEP